LSEKLGIVALLVSATTSAEIYKCDNDGTVTFSDRPCGQESTVVEIRSQQQSGNSLTNDSMERVAESLYRDRRTSELQRNIQLQRQKIQEITSGYESKIIELKKALDLHTSKFPLNRDAIQMRDHYNRRKALENSIANLEKSYPGYFIKRGKPKKHHNPLKNN